MKHLLRLFFKLLYHQFAFTYDLVAATVSLGRWKDWVLSVLPFIEGTRVLEIGYGPGHLQHALLSRGLTVVGIDESAQMAQRAKHNLTRRIPSIPSVSQNRTKSQMPQSDYAQTSLTRGLAQHLPFSAHAFDTLVATFPAEYIFELPALVEAHRVLTEKGRLIILPGASILGRDLKDRFLAWLFRITGETPPDLSQILHEKSKGSFAKAGFQVQVQELEIRSSIVFIMIATRVSPQLTR